MLFNSLTFAVFLPIVFALYWLLKKSTRKQNLLLLISSYVFYGWWDWRFLLLILISSGADFIIGQKLYNEKNGRQRKRWLVLSLIINLGILGFFKYHGFFMDSFAELISSIGLKPNLPVLQIILPVGISFYTFQTLSYTIDIYRNKLKPTSDIVSFFTFVAFFPQLVAGPIERAKNLLPQFKSKRVFDPAFAVSGLRLILWGLVKKTIIADRVFYIVEALYDHPGEFSSISIIFGTLLFGLQIYCDFSGYSDIAIGTARLFGIRLMINFKTPYFSQSFREFWQRWHISLSTWFRDYVYIPLGGNRSGKSNWILAIILTFGLSGLWHGAYFHYVVWGLLHGLFYLGENLFAKFWGNRWKPGKYFRILFVFTLMNFAWIFFRAANIDEAAELTGRLFYISSEGAGFELIRLFLNFPSLYYGIYTMASIALFMIIEIITRKNDINIMAKLPKYIRWSIYYFMVLWILLLGEFNTAPEFIYFQF